MEEGKKILGVFLVVLFIIIVVGVIISRTRSQTKNKPLVGGSLESILFPDRPTPKPTAVIAEKSKTTAGTTTTTTNTTKTTNQNTGSKTTSTAGQESQTQGGQGQTGQSPVVLGQSTTTTGSNGTTTTTTSGSNGSTTGSTTTTSTPDMSKGGVDNAQNIPDTGTPTVFLSFALSALGSGIALRKFSGISLKKIS